MIWTGAYDSYPDPVLGCRSKLCKWGLARWAFERPEDLDAVTTIHEESSGNHKRVSVGRARVGGAGHVPMGRGVECECNAKEEGFFQTRGVFGF